MVTENLQAGVRALMVLVLACVLTLVSRNAFAISHVDKAPNASVVTADDQAMNASDMEITKKIRQQILSNKTMSLGAQNVKIISRNGQVVLKGRVASPAEKTLIGEIAESVVGPAHVINESTIARN